MTTRHRVELEGHFFLSWRRDGTWQPWTALCELIDNSMDARARRIDVLLDPVKNRAEIIDDGRGCDDLQRFFTLGGSVAHDSSARIGRYGIGGFKAACWLCDVEEVESTHRGVTRSGRMDFSAAIKQPGQPAWEMKREHRGGQSGTRIVLKGLRQGDQKPDKHPLFSSRQQQRLREELGMTYGPALRGGSTAIRINGETVEPVPWPQALGETLEKEFTYDGLSLRVTARVVDEKSEDLGRWQAGFYIECLGRLICDMTPRGRPKPFLDGLDEYLSAPVWICVSLDEATGQWPLTPDKTDVIGRTHLLETICAQPEVRDFLRRALEQSIEVDAMVASEEFANRAAALFGGQPVVREKRESPGDEHPGAVIPIESGKTRRKAQKIHPNQEGGIEAPRPGLFWSFAPKHMGASGPALVVKVHTPKGKVIVNVDVNLDVDRIAREWRSKSFQDGILAFIIPAAVFEHDKNVAQRFYEVALPGTQISMQPEHAELMKLATSIFSRLSEIDCAAESVKKAAAR